MARRGFTPRRWIPVGVVLSLLFVWVLALRVSHAPGDRTPPHVVTASQLREAIRRADAAAVPRPTPRAGREEKPVAERRERDQDPEPTREADRLFDDLRILRIEVEIPREGEDALRRWHWRRRSSPRPEAKATVREGGRVYRDVVVQLKGAAGSFRPIDEEPALTLKFDKHVPEQRFHGLKKLSLNNSVQDASLLSEKICREIFLAAGVPVPRAGHALVKLNGRDLGLYVLVEGANKQFLKRYFTNTSGNLFDGGFIQDITEPLAVNSGDHPEDHSSLERLRDAAERLRDAASEEDRDLSLKRLEEVLDVERFLSFVALETILCHWDGYTMNRNNYRVFHDVDSGRMVFLPHGLDQAFGTGRGSPSQSIIPRTRGLVAGAILQTKEGARRYLATLTRLYRKVFDLDRILRRADEVARPIRAVLAEEQPDRVDSFLNRVEGLKDAIRERARSIDAQLADPIDRSSSSDFGIVSLSGWQSRTEDGEPEVVEEESPEGRPCLVIRAGPDAAVASWRTTLTLTSGRYRFEGRIRCRKVAGEDGELTGASLRVDDSTPATRVTGTRGWTAVSHRFRVRRGGPSAVELVCELHAASGEAWFDKQSLRVVRE